MSNGVGETARARIAIVAAMERELAPLTNGWALSTLSVQGRSLICHEGGEVVAVFSGMGCERAEHAARAVVDKYQPGVLVSAGLGGGLIPSLKVASVVLPNVIVDAASGTEYRCSVGGDVVGGGVLVSNYEIAGRKAKPELVECFHALVVDMEAAGVAKVAIENDLGFRCVKAISDQFDFDLPPLGQFVTAEGMIDTGKLVRWVSIRPPYWAAMAALARNSRKATRALCDWLRSNLRENLHAAKVVTLNGEYSKG
jgi:adenosylhomocysteine nucleosidase